MCSSWPIKNIKAVVVSIIVSDCKVVKVWYTCSLNLFSCIANTFCPHAYSADFSKHGAYK